MWRSLTSLAGLGSLRLFLLLFLSRVAIVVLLVLSDWLIDDYDASTIILKQTYGFRGAVDSACGVVPVAAAAPQWGHLLKGIRNWDGIHFTHIAHMGYTHEHLCAFFPGLPWLIRCVHGGLDLAAGLALPRRGLTHTTTSFKHGLRQVCNRTSAEVVVSMQRWGELLDLTEDIALALFVMAAYAGAGVCLRNLTNALLATQGSAISLLCRRARMPRHRFVGAVVLTYLLSSSGVFTVVLYTDPFFAFFTMLGLNIRQTLQHRLLIRTFLVTMCFVVAGLLRSNAILLSIYFVDDLLFGGGFRKPRVAVCSMLGGAATLVPYLAVNWHLFHVFHGDGGATANSVPSWLGFYSDLQRRYWNVGFLTSFTIKNIPNLFIPLPLLVFVVLSAMRWGVRSEWFAVIRDGHFMSLATMIVTALTVMHVQVTVRFLFPAPALYWMFATLLAGENRNSHVSLLFFTWLAAWILFGTLAFSNHFPWT